MFWHHRTIRHIDSRYPDDDEPFYTAHEFSFEDNEYDGFTFGDSVAQSKEEAEMIFDAFDYPPVIEVDEADFEMQETPFGERPHYTKYVWLNKDVNVKKLKENHEHNETH